MTQASDPPDDNVGLARRILDTALDLGEQRGWDALHLHDIAAALDVGLDDIARHYAHKDALAEAWFDRADAALLAVPQAPGWRKLSPRDRLHRAIFAWLGALAAHRRLTATMLRYKFQPEHPHLQVQGLLRVSRTVQWIREVAHLSSAGLRRELEEVALTTMFMAAFACWLGDDSAGSERTRALLDRMLANAERLARLAPGGTPPAV